MEPKNLADQLALPHTKRILAAIEAALETYEPAEVTTEMVEAYLEII